MSRPACEQSLSIRKASEAFINALPDDGTFISNDLLSLSTYDDEAALRRSRVYVANMLRSMEKDGTVKRTGETVKAKEGRGKPSVQYKKNVQTEQGATQ